MGKINKKELLSIKEATQVLKTWAEMNPLITGLLLYGSYIDHAAKRIGDIDIALTVHCEEGDNDELATFWYHQDEWAEQLKTLLKFAKIHLEWYDASATRVKSYIEKSAIVVYDKSGQFRAHKS